MVSRLQRVYEGKTINAFDKHKNHSLYYTLRSSLMNAFGFSSNTYAFIIFEGYINMALIKDCIYLCDSHSQNVCGSRTGTRTGTCLIQMIINAYPCS